MNWRNAIVAVTIAIAIVASVIMCGGCRAEPDADDPNECPLWEIEYVGEYELRYAIEDCGLDYNDDLICCRVGLECDC